MFAVGAVAPAVQLLRTVFAAMLAMPASGKPVPFVSVIDEGVPPAPLKRTGAPALPTFTPSAVAMPVPSPETPVETGKPVAFVSVADAGVPRTGATKVSAVPFVVAPVIPPKAPLLLY